MKYIFAEKLASSRVSFRMALSTLLAIMLIGTVALLGTLSYFNLKRNADDFAEQMLNKTSLSIKLWVGQLLHRGQVQNELNRSLLREIKLGPEAITGLARYWQHVLEKEPYFTLISAVFESGTALSVERLQDGTISIREVLFDVKADRAEVRDFRPDDFTRRKAYARSEVKLSQWWPTPAWYLAAREYPVWTEARTIRGAGTMAGVIYAAPFHDGEGNLLGVVTVDFDISAISDFLDDNPVGKGGFAFIVEKTAAGELRVIAHPNPGVLTRATKDERGRTQYEFVPAGSLGDERVARFVERLSQENIDHLGQDLWTFRYAAGGTEYFGSYRRITGRDMPGWIVAQVIPYEEIMGPAERNNLETLGIGAVACILILIVSAWVSEFIAKPLRRIVRESEAIGRFELEAAPLERSKIREVDLLMVATHDMKRGLRSFRKYVPADLVRAILASGGEAELGGRKAALTIFFTDIVDFTTISERLAPEVLVEQLAEYFDVMIQAVKRQPAGTIDKFMGDGIMAFWGAPTDNPDHAVLACRAALHGQERLKELRDKWAREGKTLFHQRIGINTGDVIVGNMGSAARLNYTVVGEAVNAASRFEGLNKFYGTGIIIGERTRELVKEHFVTRPLDLVSVKGSEKGVRIYELMAETGNADERTRAIAALAEKALKLYLERRWDEAGMCCGEILELNRGDEPARILMERCRTYRETPPPLNWTGIHRFESK